MADDASSTFFRRRGRRGPLVIVNPDNDSDQETHDRPPQRPPVYQPQPLPSPSTRSPYSETIVLPPTTAYAHPQASISYPPARPLFPIMPDPPSNYPARYNPSNTSLSSPSGSSSPAVESTPPPSTPGHIAVSESGATVTSERYNGIYNDLGAEMRPQNSGRMSMMDRIKGPFMKPQKLVNSRPSTSPIITTSSTSPMHESIAHKVLLTVTADCDNYTCIDITGAHDALLIKEKIFSKLQIPDDQQPFFSIYRTEIGSYATSSALSSEQLFELCRDEGDSKGSLKVLAQHSSAQVHLTPPPQLVPNHVPPVLPYHESFTSPSQKAKSTRSNNETRSSSSEPFPMDPVMTGYEGSVSDELEHADKDALRGPARPPNQSAPRTPFGIPNPKSPLGSLEMREQSSARRTYSPVRANEYNGSRVTDMRGMTTPISQPFSPSASSSYFEEGTVPHYNRRTHGHSASDATAEKDRVQDLADKQSLIEGYNRRRPDRTPKGNDETAKKGSQEAWVVVPSPKTERPSTGDAVRPHPPINRNGPRLPHVLPQIPNPPTSRPPPPVPPESNRPRNGQYVPLNWVITSVSPSGIPRSNSDQRQKRLSVAKSMDNLRSTRKNNARPAIREANSSAGSFMHMDTSSPYTPSNIQGQNSRPSKLTTQNSNDTNQIQNRPTGSVGQDLGSGSLLTPNSTWRLAEQPIPRPRSVLDDIGASPLPPRKLPQLPGAGPSSFPDQDVTYSPGLTSPHHPYGPVRPNAVTSTYTTVSNKGSDGSSTFRAESEISDTQTIVIERSFVATSPDSPRRTPVEREKRADFTGSAVDAQKSFVPLSHESPTSVYDGDNEANGKTVSPNVRDWLVSQIALSSSSEGTLRANGNFRAKDKPSASPITREDSTTSTRTSATTDTGDEIGYGYGRDEEDTGTSSSLWHVKPQPSLTSLTITTENPSVTHPARSPPHITSSHIPPPPFPPPTLPPPPVPVVQSRKLKGDKDRSNRDSQFIRKSESTWAFRPYPEEISERLDSFFPDHDLDKPVIESSSSGGSSPTAAEPAIPGFQNSSADKDKKSRHKKSIRIVAAEQHKKKNERGSRSDSSTMSSIMRKRSTKLWGSKLEEVSTSQIPTVPPVPESPTAQNPKPIFKWVRGELIGKGTYGRVYLALNATTGEMIAVKQVELPKTESDRDDKRQISVVEALKLESETLKDLDHPNIVQYLGFEQTPDFLSIFLEYVPGGSVAGCLRKHGKFEDQITRSFTGQILDGLAYLHRNGVIHRDLKADNILVETSGICKISDFGIAKRTEDINENGVHTSMQGSIFWMAPEVMQAARKGEQHGYNGKVDIWSLGCVVLEMWAGRRPWQDADAIAVIYELITTKGAPPVPPDVVLTPDADDFRQKCFGINPDDRPSAPELRSHPYLVLQPGWSFTGFK